MTNEAILRVPIGLPIAFTCADATAITKGALLALTDPRTAILASSAAQAVAGIAFADKVANDTQTQIAVWRTGIFDMVCSGAVTLGAAVATPTTGSLNYISGAALGASQFILSGAALFGHALETGSDNERILVQLTLA